MVNIALLLPVAVGRKLTSTAQLGGAWVPGHVLPEIEKSPALAPPRLTADTPAGAFLVHVAAIAMGAVLTLIGWLPKSMRCGATTRSLPRLQIEPANMGTAPLHSHSRN